jgi:hypothetical protein
VSRAPFYTSDLIDIFYKFSLTEHTSDLTGATPGLPLIVQNDLFNPETRIKQ